MSLVIDLFLEKTRADGSHHEVHKLNRQSFVSIQFYLGTIEERYSNIHSPAQYALYKKRLRLDLNALREAIVITMKIRPRMWAER